MGKESNKVRVGISIGDMNGIGLEVIMKSFIDNRILKDITPVIYGSSKVVSYHRKALDLNDFNFLTVQDADEIKDKKINLINCWNEEVNIEFGQPSNETGRYAIKSLELATEDLAGNKIDVLVTAPIDKLTVQHDSFKFPGHTEYLASLSNVSSALMLMVADDLRIGTVTGHIPLKDVAGILTEELIIEKLTLLEQSLIKDFGIRRPKIAVLGLNPHAGDNGLLGDEENRIIEPAINKFKGDSKLVYGPYAADGFFGSGNFKNFDAVLAMYHDQGLTPFKTLTFDRGVNYTAGLPIVRTSPDHGTGYEIAGKNIASEASFRNAVYLARDIFLKRKFEKDILANAMELQSSENEKR